ncbi:AcCoA-C-Actrans: acetyl-CoA C-acetyltransferase [Rubrobacter radiotolerans]|uniref:AcCoA-C-Actrans: acetyl-CoA C-acetyltransferase n=1 Tax=Rubrobacter radiotolerans TaxID=42256 RepID=A0A023X4W1_RUBRA|nr:thiolase family protein [Rubrobacter radiotolerans]AHY47388.1 AcCoA-C-Actrans: acetyl-CoA C-acetyltransferase [Rubrobacter radiotolerans]MDX5894791.1 thiolase family protein [Rubrobacter radiotolerans]SMC06770.1 acetyl-CoA acyltransferase [Rubrobacter radiotolerans DSM 5868]
MSEAVIIEAVRTPFGKRNGAFREIRPDSLLAHALRGLVERAGVEAGTVEDVVTGCVTQAGEQGANIGRLAVMLADFPVEVPAVTLNRMCGSSQQAVHFASQAVAAGDISYAIGCGIESMSRAPMFSDIDFEGGGFEKLNPALLAKQDLIHQGESAERIADRWTIGRDDVDAFAAESHRRAAARQSHPEIIPVTGRDADGNEVEVTTDEGVRPNVDPEKMASLKTVFRPGGDGVVTAGNSSQISDGASAVLVGDRERAEADGLVPKARFRARVAVGDDPTMQLTGVIPATRAALKKAGVSMNDLDWIEINEAFATVVLSWADDLKPDMEKVNPWGGAIAHGHPLGATGAGLMAKLVAGLEATDGTLGLQVMCIGHGMATATVVERI